MLTGNGVPNDVIGNFNSLSIIVLGPILNVSYSVSRLRFRLAFAFVNEESANQILTVRTVPLFAQV